MEQCPTKKTNNINLNLKTKPSFFFTENKRNLFLDFFLIVQCKNIGRAQTKNLFSMDTMKKCCLFLPFVYSAEKLVRRKQSFYFPLLWWKVCCLFVQSRKSGSAQRKILFSFFSRKLVVFLYLEKLLSHDLPQCGHSKPALRKVDYCESIFRKWVAENKTCRLYIIARNA
jgi:hypothetical protein